MEGIIIIATFTAALAVAFTMGYRIGKDRGFGTGTDEALKVFKETINTEESELIPCPFCGGEAKVHSEMMAGEIHIWADCKECHRSRTIFSRPSWMAPITPWKITKDDPWLASVYKAQNRRINENGRKENQIHSGKL